jgi:hypothetical protein
MATSLLEFISDLLRDSDARHEFRQDPERYADHHGFHNLGGADVHDALSLLADNDRWHSDHGWHVPAPGRFDGGHEHGAHYLRGYFNDHRETFDGHDTDLDNSVHQNIDTGRDRDHDRHDDDRHDNDRDHDRHDNDRHDNDRHDNGRHDNREWDRDDRDFRHDRGGDFHQTIDNDPVVASGHGAVAAGGDIRDSTVTSGHGNVVGDHNQAATGNDNTTAFGSGDATKANLGHSNFGDGSGVSLNGNAEGHNTDNDTTTQVHSSGSGSTAVNAAGDHGYADQHADQHESDSSSHSSYENNSHTDSNDNYNSHNDSRYEDSHNTDLHHA